MPKPVNSQPVAVQWKSGICDCCKDMATCCYGLWCPFCLMCNTTKKYGESKYLPLVDLFCGILIPPVTYSMRSSMRERYRIQGSMSNDCCVSTFCGICVWCQIARELEHRRQQPQVIVNSSANAGAKPKATTP